MSQASERLPLFENARALLILLVAAGHAVEPLIWREPWARGVYSALYLFHIPAFAFLSGHLSSPRAGPRAVLRSLIAPLLVFQVLYVAFDVYVLGHPPSDEWLSKPYWLLWFLLSLACWRLLLPLFARLPAPVPVAVAIALAAGVASELGYPYSLSRTLVFLPFFIAGHALSRERLVALSRWRVFGAIVLLLLAGWGAAIALGAAPAPDPRWLYGSSSYAALGVAPLQGTGQRAVLTLAGAAGTLAFFACCPRRGSPLTGFGGRSLAPFLLHGFVIRGLNHAGGFQWVGGPLGVAAAFAFGLALAWALGHPGVVRLSAPLWNPLGFRAPSSRPAGSPQ